MRYWIGALPTLTYPGSGLADSVRGQIMAALLAEVTDVPGVNTVSHHRDLDAEPYQLEELTASMRLVAKIPQKK